MNADMYLDAYGYPAMGDCAHWFGLPPEGCADRSWLPYMEAVTIGMPPCRKITVRHPSAKQSLVGSGR